MYFPDVDLGYSLAAQGVDKRPEKYKWMSQACNNNPIIILLYFIDVFHGLPPAIIKVDHGFFAIVLKYANEKWTVLKTNKIASIEIAMRFFDLRRSMN